MNTQRKWLGLAVLVVLLLAIASLSTFAQETETDETTPTTPGYGWHMGGMMGDEAHHEAMLAAFAEALGMDVDALITELQAGKTLAEIAEANDVEKQVLYDAALAVMTEHLTTLVEAGTITQAQADAHMSWMQENMATMPIFTMAGYQHCMDGMAMMMGQGMMGHGMMMGQGMMIGQGMMMEHGGMMGSGRHGRHGR